MSQITTHILDTATGNPATGVSLQLSRQCGDGWESIAEGITNDDGRVPGLLNDDTVLEAGNYRICFDTAGYFERCSTAGFYPWVDIVFTIEGDGQHYHIPLLLSPYGYSTYRGS